jgi:hypothetical protein
MNGTLVAAHGGVATPWNSKLFRVVARCAGATLALHHHKRTLHAVQLIFLG